MTVIMKFHIWVVTEQGHWHGHIYDPFGNHIRSKPHAKRVVVSARLPDRNFLRFPRLHGTYRYGLGRDTHHIAAARSPGVLHQRYRMQIDDTGGKLSKFRG